MRSKSFIAFLLIPITGHSQEAPELQRRIADSAVLEAAAIRVMGSDPTARLPLHVTMSWFLQTASSHEEVLGALASSDRELLKKAALAEASAASADAALYVSSLTGVCSDLAHTSPSALAVSMEGVAQNLANQQERRYLQLLNSLSPVGRQAVRDALQTRVAPHVSYLTADYAEIARRAPDLLQRLVQAECDLYFKGPPAAPESPGETNALTESGGFELRGPSL